MSAGVLIIGSGHAGDSMAAVLRQLGWKEPVCILGEEGEPPYDRPSLSKDFLKTDLSRSRLALRPAEFYASNGIEIHLGKRVVEVDRETRTVELSDGTRREYDYLVIATGSRHRVLEVPGATSPGVFQLRTLSDALRLKDALTPGRRLAIVGGGYVGLEVASSAAAMGVIPIVIERELGLLSRAGSEMFSRFLERLHRTKGTEVLLDAQIEALCPITGVHLKDGRVIPCDAVLVGIGALANDELAKEAGLRCNDGVIVDQNCRTNDARIFAIGDCCRRDVAGFGDLLRLESIPSALEQVKTAASAIVGREMPKPEVPWFWSDQFGIRIQIAGLLRGVRESFTRGDPDNESFAIFHLDSGRRLRAVEAFGRAPDFVLGKSLIQAAVSIPSAYEQRPLAELKKLLS